MENELFINARYLGTSASKFNQYYNHKGVLKRYIPSRFSRKIIDHNNLWCKLSDLPGYLQEELSDMSNTLEEIMYDQFLTQGFYDSHDVRIFIDQDTLVLPVVGKVLATDGTPAFTVVEEDNTLIIKPILVCWNCHWSDLFAGNTKYGNNVFCMFSDLSENQKEIFKGEAITVGELPEYLGLENTKIKVLKKKSKN